VETTAAIVYASDPNPITRPMSMRDVFRFAVTVSATTYASSQLSSQIDAAVQRMKPAHTAYTLTVNAGGFLYDDANSLMDRDVLTT
jgi:hypothetical protein